MRQLSFQQWSGCFCGLLMIAFAAACATPPNGGADAHGPPPTATDLPRSPSVDRRVAAGDILNIYVVGHEDMTGEYRVENEGAIRFPYLAGTLEVAGKTTEEVARMLEERLRQRVLTNPIVAVRVKNYRVSTVAVLGSVGQQGTIELTGEVPLDVLAAIGRAGGFLPVANKDRIELTRGGTTYRYSFESLLHPQSPNGKIILEPGDVIYVPESRF